MVTRKFDTNSSSIQLIKSLGWFNVVQRLDYLCVLLMHKCVKGEAPYYLSDQFLIRHSVYYKHTYK